ncbi:MAG: HAMP domain-containing sensor histidine kinase [Oceanobacter sp.]
MNMDWCRSLFFKVLAWFWLTIVLAMILAGLTIRWLDDDFIRVATDEEVTLLLRLMDHIPPVAAEGHKLWGPLHPGWNLVVVPLDGISELPHDIEEFADRAADRGEILYGQDDGWIMMGPVQRQGFLYTAVSHPGWSQILESHYRWVAPAVAILAVTLLCFFLVWHLTGPIRRLQHSVRHMAEGNFDVSDLKVDFNRQDEIGQLVREVSKMANATHRLLNSQEQLLRDVSHELRSPLARLQIALGIARKKDAEQLIWKELDRIERAGNQVENLIKQILDLARLDQLEHNQLQTQERKVTVALGQWLEDAELELDGKKLKTELVSNLDYLKCPWDWMLIERAFDNLLRNAIRFSPEEGRIQVRAMLDEDKQCVSISVRDEGPGVPDDMVEHIFDAFRQVDHARSPGQSNVGYGIGLALVKRILELHQGEVTAINRHPGLEVTLRLPVRISEQ